MTAPVTHSAHQVPVAVTRAVADASARTGIGFEYLMDKARLESGFRADAKAPTSSAQGLYQFTASTWLGTVKQHGPDHGLGWAASIIQPNGRGGWAIPDPGQRAAILQLRNDPDWAALMAAEHASDNRDEIRSATGREPADVDLYLAHFLGASGAIKFLDSWSAKPSATAATLFPEAASANRSIFYSSSGSARSFDEIRNNFARKLGQSNGYGHGSSGLSNRANTSILNRRPLEMQEISPMPKGLSLELARDAYRRLASTSEMNS